MPNITHVVFDLDGLLIDTESIYTKCTQRVCDRFGKTFTTEIKVKQMGRKFEDASRILIQELDLPITVEELRDEIGPYFAEEFPNADLLSGAEKLIRHLHRHGIPIAIASGSEKDKYEQKISKHGELFSLFNHVVLSGTDPEVKQGKPAPDVFLVAARRFNQVPDSFQEVLVFEDAENGVEAAVAACMPVVMVPSVPRRYISDETMKKASQVLNSLEEFRPEEFGLPGFTN